MVRASGAPIEHVQTKARGPPRGPRGPRAPKVTATATSTTKMGAETSKSITTQRKKKLQDGTKVIVEEKHTETRSWEQTMSSALSAVTEKRKSLICSGWRKWIDRLEKEASPEEFLAVVTPEQRMKGSSFHLFTNEPWPECKARFLSSWKEARRKIASLKISVLTAAPDGREITSAWSVLHSDILQRRDWAKACFEILREEPNCEDLATIFRFFADVYIEGVKMHMKLFEKTEKMLMCAMNFIDWRDPCELFNFLVGKPQFSHLSRHDFDSLASLIGNFIAGDFTLLEEALFSAQVCYRATTTRWCERKDSDFLASYDISIRHPICPNHLVTMFCYPGQSCASHQKELYIHLDLDHKTGDSGETLSMVLPRHFAIYHFPFLCDEFEKSHVSNSVAYALDYEENEEIKLTNGKSIPIEFLSRPEFEARTKEFIASSFHNPLPLDFVKRIAQLKLTQEPIQFVD